MAPATPRVKGGLLIDTIDQPPTWQVRPLGPEDIDAVGEVLGLARLHQGDGSYLVAWGAATPVGHVHLTMTDPPEIQDLEVRPSHRRLGIATALIAAAEEQARACGSEELRLEVSVNDEAVQRLYRDRGYLDAGLPVRRVTGRIMVRTGPIDVDDTLLVMSKRLRRH